MKVLFVSRFARLALACAFSLPLAALATADLSFGGTRAQGMGGAGLALPVDLASNHRLNPAFLGLLMKSGHKKFDLEWPSIGFRAEGIGLGDLRSNLGNPSGAGIDKSKLETFARQFGRRRTEFGLNGSAGLILGNVAVSGGAEADVTGIPNATLMTYGGTGVPADGSRLDMYGLGYYSVNVGTGMPVTMKDGNLSVGATAKFVRGYYSHQRAFWAGGAATSGSGAEMGGSDVRSKNGLGIDLGTIYNHPSNDKVFYGLVIENLIQPNIKFSRQLPGAEGAPILRDNVNIFRTAFNLGVGAKVTENTLAAFDVIDLGNRAGRSQLALGAEHMLGKIFALRAGYNSRTGFTVGVAVGGFNINLSGKAPLTAAAAFRF